MQFNLLMWGRRNAVCMNLFLIFVADIMYLDSLWHILKFVWHNPHSVTLLPDWCWLCSGQHGFTSWILKPSSGVCGKIQKKVNVQFLKTKNIVDGLVISRSKMNRFWWNNQNIQNFKPCTFVYNKMFPYRFTSVKFKIN